MSGRDNARCFFVSKERPSWSRARSRARQRATPEEDRAQHGATAFDRRAGADLVARAEGRVVVQERLPRRHGAALAAFGLHRLHAGRHPGRDLAVHRRQDRHQRRRGADLGDPGLRDVPHLRVAGLGQGLHDPGEQLHPVDRHGRGLRGLAAVLVAGGVHAVRRPHRAVVADDDLDDRHRGAGRAGGVPDEAALHQRGPAPLPRGSRLRRGAGLALHRRGRRRHVQGQAAGQGGGGRRDLPGADQRRLDEAAAVQAAAHGQVGRHDRALDLP